MYLDCFDKQTALETIIDLEKTLIEKFIVFQYRTIEQEERTNFFISLIF